MKMTKRVTTMDDMTAPTKVEPKHFNCPLVAGARILYKALPSVLANARIFDYFSGWFQFSEQLHVK